MDGGGAAFVAQAAYADGAKGGTPYGVGRGGWGSRGVWDGLVRAYRVFRAGGRYGGFVRKG